MLRAILIISASLGCLSCTNHIEEQTAKFAIDLNLPQPTFVTGEVIYVEATVRNQSNDTLIILDPTSERCLHKIILDSNGDHIPMQPIVDYFGPPPTILLRPREETFIVVDFRMFGNAGRLGPNRAFSPGRYEVWVELDSILSNKIPLVVEDVPKDEIAPFEALVSLDSILADHQRAHELATNCLSNFSQSVYAPNFLYLVCFHARYLNEHTQVMTAAKKIVEEFPSSGCVYYAVNYYQQGFLAARGVSRANIATPDDLLDAASALRVFSSSQPENRVLSYWVEYYIKGYRGWWEGEKKHKPLRPN